MAACSPGRFELVFLEPPFDAGLAVPALAAALRLVVPGGWVAMEHGAEAPPLPEGLLPWRELRAGAVRVQLLRRG